MKVRDIVAVLDGTLLVGESLLDLDIDAACGADLMSDVMAFVKENVVLLTGLINPQSIRTADLMDIRVIVFVRGKSPTPVMLAEAEKNGMAVIATSYSMFVSCGRLYEGGIRYSGTRAPR
ncbi:MAG: hypothetical protein JXM71_01370 [Spirochaetales bacterium]|nr:hypothetical protein [Spirochaetales bacterium]